MSVMFCFGFFFSGNVMVRALIIMDTFNFFLCWNLRDPGSNVFMPVHSGLVGEFAASSKVVPSIYLK